MKYWVWWAGVVVIGMCIILGTTSPARGAFLGQEFTISTASSDQRKPSVAYDPINQRFLVAWLDFRSGQDIYGQLISDTGILIGSEFTITTAPNNQEWPSMSYDSVNQRFLVTWNDYCSGCDIYGRLVLSGGITTANLPSGYTSIPYYAVLQVLGGTLPYTWGIASGVLPPGLNLIPSTGEIYGMPSTIGVYSFTIKVTEAIGLSDTAPLTITINNLNQPPIVALTASPTTGVAPLQVTFTATASDPDGSIAQYRWDFTGDGITDLTTATGTTTFTYSTPGAYLAQVTAVDNLGATASAYAVVSVSSPPEPSNQPPVVTLIASPISGSPPLYVTFTATASDSDGSIAQYRWDFTGAQNVTLTTLTGDASYTYTAPGVFLAQVSVVDDMGATAFAFSIINVESFKITERELGKWGCGCSQALTSSSQGIFSTLVLVLLPMLYVLWRKKMKKGVANGYLC